MFRNKQIKNMNPNEDKWSQLNDSQKNKISLLLKKKKAKKANDGNTYTNIEKSSLSLSQRRIWFLQHMNRNDVSYNMPFSIKLVGNVNFEILQKSFNIMFKCNDSLRMCFPSDNGIPIIKIEKEVIPNIKRIDVENEKEESWIFIMYDFVRFLGFCCDRCNVFVFRLWPNTKRSKLFFKPVLVTKCPI